MSKWFYAPILAHRVHEIMRYARLNKTDWRDDIRFEIEIDGIVWVNSCENNNPWDCWLTKKGTKGKTRNTFKRISLKDCR